MAFLNESNLEQPTPNPELAANISTVGNTTAKLLNSSKWLFEDDVIKNFRWDFVWGFVGCAGLCLAAAHGVWGWHWIGDNIVCTLTVLPSAPCCCSAAEPGQEGAVSRLESTH